MIAKKQKNERNLSTAELDPSDLLSMPLMHEKDRRWWTEWFRMAGLTSGNVPRAPASIT
jgi:hypothetical protein|tara:strand:+ start:294 stop:470 length:177 start_codon:yes stop_codon:yes gene_type:complete